MVNEVGTLVGINVQSDVADSYVIDAARGYLGGYTGAYYLFAVDSSNYCLVLADSAQFVQVGNSYYTEMSDCQVIQFTRVDTSVNHTSNIPYSGSVNGTVTGIESGGILHASSSGSSTYTYTTTDTKYYCIHYQRASVKVSNPDGYLTYGSADYLPHLVEGVENYAFLAVCCFCAVCAFKLADRLFRRVY